MTTDEIRDYFARKGVTQQELARFIDVSPRTVRRWFNGASVPRLLELAIEADIFDTVRQPSGKTVTRLVMKQP